MNVEIKMLVCIWEKKMATGKVGGRCNEGKEECKGQKIWMER